MLQKPHKGLFKFCLKREAKVNFGNGLAETPAKNIVKRFLKMFLLPLMHYWYRPKQM